MSEIERWFAIVSRFIRELPVQDVSLYEDSMVLFLDVDKFTIYRVRLVRDEKADCVAVQADPRVLVSQDEADRVPQEYRRVVELVSSMVRMCEGELARGNQEACEGVDG